ASSSLCSSSRRATWEPTEPPPSSATRRSRYPFTLFSPFVRGRSIDRARDKFFFGFASHDDAGLTVMHRDDGRARQVVVVARERPAVGTGGRHREHISRHHVTGQQVSLHDDVARFAVLAHHADERGG